MVSNFLNFTLVSVLWKIVHREKILSSRAFLFKKLKVICYKILYFFIFSGRWASQNADVFWYFDIREVSSCHIPIYFYIFRKFSCCLFNVHIYICPHHHLYCTASPRICLSQNAWLSLTCVQYFFQKVAVSLDKLSKKMKLQPFFKTIPPPPLKKSLKNTYEYGLS